MKYLFVIYFLVTLTSSIEGQNLLLNSGFEEVNICSEYQAPCAPEAWFRLPPTDVNVNTKKENTIYKGNTSELVVVENKNKPLTYRVFLYSMLLKPLQKDSTYQLSLYINPLKHDNFDLGVLLTDHELVSGEINPLNYVADLHITPTVSTQESKHQDWYKVKSVYKAKGGERFISFGNFDKKPLPNLINLQSNNTMGDIIYLIDDIEFSPSNININTPLDTMGLKNQLYQQNHRHTYNSRISKDNITDITPLNITNQLPNPKSDSIHLFKPKHIFEIPDLAFDFDKASIKRSYFNRLDSIINIIDVLNPELINIEGHTDNIGSFDYNSKLSFKRANSVRHYLEKRIDTKKAKYSVLGKGELEPIADNNTSLGRARNRRVVISIQ